jgi:hypothetical protein
MMALHPQLNTFAGAPDACHVPGLPTQVESAAEEVRRREVAVSQAEARAAATLEEVAAREAAAKASAAELARLEKQLGARKLEAQELQVWRSTLLLIPWLHTPDPRPLALVGRCASAISQPAW